MENAVEALKIAFAMMMFVLALTLCISSFSSANTAATSIIKMTDREAEYTYVEPSGNLTRIVGIETVISTIYSAYNQNLEIYFFENDGKTPIALYNSIDDSTGSKIEMSSIDAANQLDKFGTIRANTKGYAKDANEHLEILLGGTKTLNEKSDQIKDRYTKMIIHPEGLYEFLKKYEFEEKLGEYEEDKTSGQKKRVITYIKQ